MKVIIALLLIILSHEDERIAGLCIDIAKHSNANFSDQSIHLAKSLKSIPAAFFARIRDFAIQKELYTDIILSMVKILSLHDFYTKEHSQKVADLSSAIAQKMDLSEKEVDATYWTGLLHDIGKIFIPDPILNKKASLTDHEFELIKKHPY